MDYLREENEKKSMANGGVFSFLADTVVCGRLGPPDDCIIELLGLFHFYLFSFPSHSSCSSSCPSSCPSASTMWAISHCPFPPDGED